MTEPLLEIDALEVEFVTRRGIVQAVRGSSLSIGHEETLGIVGESGSGKSVMSQAAMGLVHVPGKIVGGDIRWQGQTLLGEAGKRQAKLVRGREMSMIFQDAMSSLNPLFTCGQQITEVIRYHLKLPKAAARKRAIELLELVGITAPDQRVDQFPFEMSGGMRQRVMIAMALACEPKLLIADEPTTALDVTTQAQVLDLLKDLRKKMGLSIIMITHDLGVVANLCDRVAVMYGGQIVEESSVTDLFQNPAHPYSMGLLRSTLSLSDQDDRMLSIGGSPPDLANLPKGCSFAERCPSATEKCTETAQIKPLGAQRRAACHFPFGGGGAINSTERAAHDA